jgi:hypothetical protein
MKNSMPTRNTTTTVPASRPRNPWVTAALARVAGRHGPSAGAQRQQARQGLREELRRLPQDERWRHT